METSLERVQMKDELIHINNNKLFFNNRSARDLVNEYDSPLYLYSEKILRDTCRSLKKMIMYPDVEINYSVKANTNLQILKLIREEGFHVDAVSPGEIFLEEKAGYLQNEIFFISNNASTEEFKFAVERNIMISVDSLSQLHKFGQLFPGKKIAVRINPGKGAGHHEKVITAGEKSKFGIPTEYIDEIHKIAKTHNLTITGLNMHIGSNYLESSTFLNAVSILLLSAFTFKNLDFIDIGGGFGIPYRPGEISLDILALGKELDTIFDNWTQKYGKQIRFFLEPGRYVVAQSGILLAQVESIKKNPTRTFIGTDAGFNVLTRPMTYGSYHEIINCNHVKGETNVVDISGNICESGDLFAHNRNITQTKENDVLAILDAGAYGYSMASNYNARLRPAEVLMRQDGTFILIRKRDTLEDLLLNQIF